MWTKKRHKIVFAILRFPFRIFFKFKNNFKAIKYKLEKKPYLILSNHLTTLDPFMLSCSFDRAIYFMSSSDLFCNKYSKLINWLVAPIPKNKSVNDIGAIKGCLRVIKEGGTVCVFPEGNRSYDGSLCYIDSSISKFVKMLKVDVVLYNIHGGYGIDPRWSKKTRKGYSYGRVKRVLKYEEIKEMDNESLYKLILKELRVIETPTPYLYKTKNRALGLERALYICPICKEKQTIYTKGNFIRCKNCCLEVRYNSNLSFSSNNKNFHFQFVKDWYNYQIKYVKGYDYNHQNIIYFDENVKLLKIEFGKKGEVLCEGKLEMYSNCIRIFGKGQSEFLIKDIFSMTVVGKHKLNFYIDKDIYQLIGDESFNALKYMQMYYHIINCMKGEKDEFFGM